MKMNICSSLLNLSISSCLSCQELLKYGRSLLPELESAHPVVGICDLWFSDTSPEHPAALWTRRNEIRQILKLSSFPPGRRWGPCPLCPLSAGAGRPEAGTSLLYCHFIKLIYFGKHNNVRQFINLILRLYLSHREGGCQGRGALYSGKSRKSCGCQSRT